MPQFRYLAVDPAGKPIKGVREAASASDIADWAYAQRCYLVRAEDAGKRSRIQALLDLDIDFRHRLSKGKVAHLTRELAVMLEAGQDIDHALRFLAETSESAQARRVLQALRDQVRGGKSLAASLAQHPRVFSRLYVSIVRAGEAGGTIAECLHRLADLLERECRLAATVQSAMTYPALLLMAAAGTIVLLLTYVLPQFTPIFAQAGARMPLSTRALIAAGAFLHDDGALLLLVTLTLVLLGHRKLQDAPARLVWERAILRVPVLGTLIRRAEAARLMRTLATLLRNGVGLVPALGIARDVLARLTAVSLIDKAIVEVKSGARLATALASGEFFPVHTIHLVQLGEETGRLADMAQRAADIHEEQVQHTTARLIALLLPVITIVMGLVVAGIVGSLVVAMLSLNDLAL